MSVAGLEPLLSDEGWVHASAPPVAEGDPGRYHALFGRDSLITALQVLPARPDVARATLRALAALQGQRDDPETDEEPGKILHEHRPEAPAWHTEHHWPVRDGELRYYGSSDSTSWFLVLLAALGDDALTAELEPAWRAAGAWLRARARQRPRAGALRPARAAGRPDPAGLARRHGPGRGRRRRQRHRAARRLDAARSARRRRRAVRGVRGAARAGAAVGRGRVGAPRGGAGRPAGARLRARRDGARGR